MADFAPAQALPGMGTALFADRGPWRLRTALSVSLLVHGLLLSITIGGEAFGLPGLHFPWEERRLGPAI